MAIQLDSGLSSVVSAGKGVFAGAAGTAVMTLAQTKLWPPKVLEKIPSGYRPKPPRFPSNREEPVTEVVARRFVEGVLRRPLRGRAKRWAGQLVHFGTGAACGAVLALLARGRLGFRHGLLFGTIVWALNDNLAVPAMRLADWPSRYPLGVHLGALASHLVYGVTTALVLDRALRR